MKIVCPECQSQFPLSAGLLDAEAKRFGVALASVEPILGRALIQYVTLYKPAKSALRLTKATKIVEEVAALVAAGEVRRNGVRRPASVAVWARAIEHMLDTRGKLRLPLGGHGYLIEVVYGLADQADSGAERKREADLRAGRHRVGASPATPAENPLANELAWLRQQLGYKAITQEQHDERARQARERHAAGGEA